MKSIYTTIFVLAVGVSFGQQLPQYSQYLFNDYAYNPAVGGRNTFIDVKSSHRYQWVGITDSPRTYTLSAHGPSRNGKHGFGGYMVTDHVGPTRRTGFQVSYSYHFRLNEDIKLSLALSAGFLQLKIDGHKIQMHDPGDNVIVDGVMTSVVPDAKFGFYFYGDNWFFGAAAPQIIRSKLSFRSYGFSNSVLDDHYYASGGYKFDLGSFGIEPSVLVKYADPVPVQIDAMARIIYKNNFWIGGAFRTNDAISTMIGYTYKNNILLGFSYDFTTSNLKNYSTGVYEVMLGIKFTKDHTFDSKKEKLASE
ncbi:MAG: type IX secretion system membrane protein PorP/SprF [Crocinitomicaceae bacterium]|jgi:type IX secretion system PorP/SprF family membrane protein|nr:type IX secretion system membrane protein PorP/SprF [Crocinitomicaceae bacterium]MBT5402108.1 type IX secretion system membrane protein PorP/SprF [Crocinitomicaceae bacterium]MBT6029416.1 type IX secretion system membrane protein PorP/SprF [Crocinitomicaceae bacterium]MBT6513777.1 type IX secretion system membrane protein PorP/SprF [Crocinitomicaceae bacterium]